MAPSDEHPATPAGERLVALDVVRGAALFGVFLVNLPSFAMSSDVAYEPPSSGGADTAAWFVLVALGMMKCVALFSLLFGAGLALQADRAERTGRAFASFYPRRLLVLGLVGLAHGVFLFLGDILFAYALAGTLLFACRGIRPRTAMWVAAALFAVGAAASSVVLSAPVPPSPTDPLPTWEARENVTAEELERSFDDERLWAALEHKAYGEGPYRTTLTVNAVGYLGWMLIATITSFHWRVLALFFVGLALVRVGFFEARRASWHRRLLLLGALGLALELAVAGNALRVGTMSSGAIWPVLANEVGATLLAGGYLGGLCLAVHRGVLPRLAGGLAAVGRTALTNYLAQSVVGNVLFRWYGLDLYGELSYAALMAVAVLVFGLQAAASVLWLRRFPMGPLEAVWRRLTYGSGSGTLRR